MVGYHILHATQNIILMKTRNVLAKHHTKKMLWIDVCKLIPKQKINLNLIVIYVIDFEHRFHVTDGLKKCPLV